MSGDLERASERTDYSHAAFVAEERSALENAYLAGAMQWLGDEYSQPVALFVGDRWRSPVRGDKRDYRAREYTDDQGRPRLRVVIHDHKTGENTFWDDYAVFDELYRDWLERRRALTAEERATWEARRAEREQIAAREVQARAEREVQARLEAEDEQQRLDANVSAERELWGELPEHGRSGYLVRKGLPHVSGFRYEGQTLVAPMWTATGEFAGVQRINGRGRKLFTEGARKKAAFTVLGGAPELEGRIDLYDLPRFIAEGLATAVRPHQAYNESVIVAYDARNIAEVLRAICEALDAAGMQKQKRDWLRRLVILADNDVWKQHRLHNNIELGNVGLESAHQAAFELGRFDIRVAHPDFAGLSTQGSPSDFDDLARLAELAGRNWAGVVRAQIDRATLADPNVVFARDRRLHLADLKRRGATFNRWLELDDLPRGVTVVRSPQNTGKTTAMVPVIARHRAQGRRVLYISHRVTLSADAARRLGLELYSDYLDRGLLRLIGGLAICAPSLHKLEDADGYLDAFDTIVIDESEESVPSLTGSHMRFKRAALRVLSRLVARAEQVVCLDADAGQMTAWALARWRGGERINWLENHWDVGEGRTVNVYPHLAQVYGQLGSGVLASTDGRSESRRMAFTLAAQGVSAQLINGETSHDPQNVSFVSDINRHAATVDSIVCSPSVSTGVSLDDPRYRHASGVFYGGTGPASGVLQGMWRARQADIWDLWLRSGGSGDTIDVDARYGAALDAELERVGMPQHLTQRDDFGYAELKKRVAQRSQRARCTFDRDAIRLMVLQGFNVRLVERPTDDEVPALRQTLADAHEREHDAWAEERHSADRYDRATVERLRERGPLTSRELYGVQRWEHADFFKNLDDPQLLTWLRADYRARYREQLERLEYTLTDGTTAHAYAQQLLDRVEMREDVPLTLTRRDFNQRVLVAVRFEAAVAALYDALTPDELEEAAQHGLTTRAHGLGDDPPPIAARLRQVTLAAFPRYSLESDRVRALLEWIEANRPLLVGVVALPTPDELRANPVRYIRSWLKTLGLRQVRVGKNARGEYALDGGALALAAHVFTRRGAGTLFLKPLSIEKVFPDANVVPDGTSPPGLERLRLALTSGHLRDSRPAPALLAHYRLADAGDETARDDLLRYLNDPAVQHALDQAPPPPHPSTPPSAQAVI